MMRSTMMATVAAALVCTGPADANPLKSLYTTIDLAECRQTSKRPGGGAWLCKGLDGYPVYIAEEDRRTFVSVGRQPQKRRAARQTLGAFNSLFQGKSHRATLEWRFVRQDGKVQPFATIQRYFTNNDSGSGEVLVVTKVTRDEDCHVAHIDALANPQAIALARDVADNEARRFDCRSEPKRVGKRGASPM
ncbi:MAG: hypothetical protein AB7L90_02455 [Hyphomicrobiaceae bacterium]